jgi:hypothetical protein
LEPEGVDITTRFLATLGMTAIVALAAFAAGCDDDGGDDAAQSPTTAATTTAVTPNAERAATARIGGRALLDEFPLESEFLGVRVRRDGLVAACQDEIVSPTSGQYNVGVFSEADEPGCGAPGAEIILWASVGDQLVYSQETFPWPGDGVATTFDATFSTTDPDGANLPATEFVGGVTNADGSSPELGTMVEAHVDGVLCGRSSVKDYEEFIGFTIAVVGPDSVDGCTANGTIIFTVGGVEANETSVNDFAAGRDARIRFDLTLK